MTNKQDPATLTPSARLFAREWDAAGVPIRLHYAHRLHRAGRYDITVDAIHPATGVVLLNGARWSAVYEHGVVAALGHRITLHDFMALDGLADDRERVLAPLKTRLRLALALYLELVVISSLERCSKSGVRSAAGLKADEIDDRIRELVRWAKVHEIK